MLPKKLEILNRTYKIVEKNMDESLLIGRSSFFKGEITLDSGVDSQIKADTLIHEIIHAILTGMGHELEKEDALHTEKNVLVIGNGLSTFLRDEGEAFKKIIDELG